MSNQIQLRERASYSYCARSWRQQTNPSRKKNFTAIFFYFGILLLKNWLRLLRQFKLNVETRSFTAWRNSRGNINTFTTFKPLGWKCYKTIGSYVSCVFIEIWSTWEVWRALKKLELLSATPQATLTHLSCSPNFPRASYLDEHTLMSEPIVNEYEWFLYICSLWHSSVFF